MYVYECANSPGCISGRGPCLQRAGQGPAAAAPTLAGRAPLQAAGPSPAGPQRDECSTRRPLWGPQTARRQANPAWKIRRWKARRLNEGAASSGGGQGRRGLRGPSGNVSRALGLPPPRIPRRPHPLPQTAGRWREQEAPCSSARLITAPGHSLPGALLLCASTSSPVKWVQLSSAGCGA